MRMEYGRRMNVERPLTPLAAERRARAARLFRTDAVVLREVWRAAALRRRPDWPGGWWTPAVDALTRAIAETRDPRPACVRLGRARAMAGVGMAETLADLAALYGELPEREPPAHLVRALLDAWTAATLVPAHAESCVGALPRLGTVQQFRAVLAEIIRHARRAGTPLGNRHLLLVADLVDPSGPYEGAGTAPDGTGGAPPAAGVGRARPADGAGGVSGPVGGEPTEYDLGAYLDGAALLDQPVFRGELATRFRAAFPDGEPIIRLWPGGYVVLADASAELARRTASLRRGLAELGLTTARVWHEAFPDDVRAARTTYQRLASRLSTRG
jgi:hypothetical protein